MTMKQNVSDKRTIITAILLTILMTFMEMTALPAAFFCNIQFAEVNPVYFSLMINFLIAFFVCWICKKTIIREWHFGLQREGILEGLMKYGAPAVIATIVATISFCVGLMPFDNRPSMWRVIIEGIVYYIGVGIMEELYLRGLLQNIVEKWFGKRQNAAIYAILITSVLFGVGHIFGAIGQPAMTIICKTVWATTLGIYFGAVYVKTKNLWVPIILHFLVDLCGIPFCFSTSSQYPAIALAGCVISYVLLGIYGVWIMRKEENLYE